MILAARRHQYVASLYIVAVGTITTDLEDNQVNRKSINRKRIIEGLVVLHCASCLPDLRESFPFFALPQHVGCLQGKWKILDISELAVSSMLSRGQVCIHAHTANSSFTDKHIA